MSDYTQHDKLRAVISERSVICGFIDFVQDHPEYTLRKYSMGWDDIRERESKYLSIPGDIDITALLGEYFEIDPDELSREKDRMYDELVKGAA